MSPTIDREFADHLLRTFDDPSSYGVHILFNVFWRFAPAEVADAYAHIVLDDPVRRAIAEEGRFGEQLTLDRLAACPPGSLGQAAHAFLVDNGLEENLALNYRQFHDALAANGMLDAMPEALRFPVLRGFQLHDLLHVVTGFPPSPGGEIALQAFCLAQIQFPYFAMWMSVVTTRMTFIDPGTIVGLMDQITDGWRFGRTVQDIQLHPWDERLDEPLADLRREVGIAPEGRAPLAAIAV